jgi:hypothetical protein
MSKISTLLTRDADATHRMGHTMRALYTTYRHDGVRSSYTECHCHNLSLAWIRGRTYMQIGALIIPSPNTKGIGHETDRIRSGRPNLLGMLMLSLENVLARLPTLQA